VAVALLVLLLLSTYYGRAPHFDDAWNAEQAYWLWRDGYVHSLFFAEPAEPLAQLYLFHKGFIYAQAPVAGLLGFGVYAVKTTALLFAIATLVLLWRYFREAPAEARWLALVLLLGCGTLVEYSFVNRAETMVMTCGFASFMLLRSARPRYALAGVLAGLAALAHLNGTIYLAAGFLWLLWQRTNWRALLRFTLAGSLTLGLYLLDALLTGQLPRLVHQFTHAPITQGNLALWAKLAIMLRFQEIFFHSESQIPLTVVLLLTLGLAGPLVLRRQPWPPALRYLVLIVGSFWVLTARPAAYYFLLFAPFITVVIVELLQAAGPQLRGWRRTVVLAALALYPLGGVARGVHLWRWSRQQPPVVVENARLAAYMPRRGSKVVVPMDFFFGQVQHYRARSLTYYALLNDAQYQGQLPVPAFFQLLAQDSVQYLVTDHSHNQAFQVPPTAPARIGQYERVYQDEWHSVYVRRD